MNWSVDERICGNTYLVCELYIPKGIKGKNGKIILKTQLPS